MEIFLSPEFKTDLEEIQAYLQDKTKTGFINIRNEVFQTMNFLNIFPEMGHKTNKNNTYILFTTKYKYKIFYRIINNDIEILRLIHSKMNNEI
jgi:plasmid stabilization system protein ParE